MVEIQSTLGKDLCDFVHPSVGTATFRLGRNMAFVVPANFISKFSVSALMWSANGESSQICVNFYVKNFSSRFSRKSKTPELYLTYIPDVDTGIRPPDKLRVVRYTRSEVLIEQNTASDRRASYPIYTGPENACLWAALNYLICIFFSLLFTITPSLWRLTRYFILT